MKKTLLIALPIALFMIFIGVHAAHSYGFGARHFGVHRDFLFYRLDRLGEKLNLTSAQKSDLDSLKKDLQAMMDERDEQREHFRKNLNEQLSRGQLDTRAITSMLHSQIDDRARFSHQLIDRIGNFLSTLTPDQRKELTETILQRFQERESD
jgi:Spy/CpxP family protein refolding chaperone